MIFAKRGVGSESRGDCMDTAYLWGRDHLARFEVFGMLESGRVKGYLTRKIAGKGTSRSDEGLLTRPQVRCR